MRFGILLLERWVLGLKEEGAASMWSWATFQGSPHLPTCPKAHLSDNLEHMWGRASRVVLTDRWPFSCHMPGLFKCQGWKGGLPASSPVAREVLLSLSWTLGWLSPSPSPLCPPCGSVYIWPRAQRWVPGTRTEREVEGERASPARSALGGSGERSMADEWSDGLSFAGVSWWSGRGLVSLEEQVGTPADTRGPWVGTETGAEGEGEGSW